MRTATISAAFSGCNSFEWAPRVPNRVFWRKQLILRRGALEAQWHQLFPRHAFANLRPIRSPSPNWAAEAWVLTAEPPKPVNKAAKRELPRAAESTTRALAFQLRDGVTALR